jgi:hypothetical protein
MCATGTVYVFFYNLYKSFNYLRNLQSFSYCVKRNHAKKQVPYTLRLFSGRWNVVFLMPSTTDHLEATEHL